MWNYESAGNECGREKETENRFSETETTKPNHLSIQRLETNIVSPLVLLLDKRPWRCLIIVFLFFVVSFAVYRGPQPAAVPFFCDLYAFVLAVRLVLYRYCKYSTRTRRNLELTTHSTGAPRRK